MAIKLVSTEWCGCLDDYKREYMIDTDADLSELPECCTGSSAIAVNTGTVYMVNASGKWVVFGEEA